MLRSQVKRQGSFYVCASCRRQHQQNLAQLRSNGRLQGSAPLSTSRLRSSSVLSVSRRPGARESQNGALPIDDDGRSPQSTTAARIDTRGYSSYGKFGSGTFPGQSQADWAKGGSTIPGTTSPTPSWGGGMKGGKMQPAQGTSAWGSQASGGGIQPAKGTSILGSTGNGSRIPPAQPTTSLGGTSGQQSATSTQSTTVEGGSAWAGRINTPLPAQQGSTVGIIAGGTQSPTPSAHSSVSGTLGSQGQATPAPVRPTAAPIGGANGNQTTPSPVGATPGWGTTAATHPTAFGGASSSSSGPTTPITPNAPWSTGTTKPFKRTSGIPTLPGKSTLGQKSVFDAGLLPHEKLAIQGAQKPKPPSPPPPRPAPRSPATQPKPQNSGFDDQDFSRLSSRRATPAHSPPLPPGAEFPQLRRKWPNVDEFEALSPFNLPSKDAVKQDEAAPPAPSRPMRKPPSGLPRSERYPTWGNSSGSGAIATDPVDTVKTSDKNEPRGLGDMPLDPVEAISSKSVNVAPQALSQATERADVPSPSPPSVAPSQQIDGAPPKALGNQDSSAPSKPIDDFLTLEQAAKAPKPQKAATEPENDWGLLESDFAPPAPAPVPAAPESPEEVHAEKRREGDRKHPEHRELEWEERPRDRDRDRGRDSGRLPAKTKKRSSNRRHEYEDDVDSGFDYDAYRMRKEEARRRKEEKKAAKEALIPKTILLPEYIAVHDLAEALGVRPQQFLEDLGELGFENILSDSVMTGETAALVASEYGFDPTVDTGADEDLRPRPLPEDLSTLPPRPPIVTIMGHVDHGKTTMLDWLRKSSVAAQEHGGITQHIGAFTVRLSSGKVITFLDTPGHAAFLSMRQRGANVTDIVILVVAVDDSVKPQTLEALKHAQNAKVPIIVAINKIDKDPSGIAKVKRDLEASEVEIEDVGGDVQVVAVSGKTGEGMKDLEESILTLSEILDVRAETDGMAEGWILEASVKKHHGKAATVLVKRGTMRVGDLVVAGTTYARIRMMRNEAGVAVQEASPGTPVEVFGWRDSPMAGDMVLQAPDEDTAQAAVDYRQESADRVKAAAQKGEEEVRDRERAEQEELERMMAEEGEDAVDAAPEKPGTKTVNVLIRGDVMGSVEAVSTAVMEIGNNEVQPRILRSSPGQVSESDIDLAAAAKACIISFNSPIPGGIKRKAEDQGVQILDHTIIYALVDDVKQMLSQQLAPLTSQRVLAEAEVLEIFNINLRKREFRNVAGVRVRTGAVTRNGLYRVMRDGEKVHDGKLESLKQGKKDVSEMRKGTECGMFFEEYEDFEVGDIIQMYEEIQEKRYL
ncbi:Translation initiation factor IF-2, mitochondrial [Cytospora mali]|uniref:Translation initiation factor IF-2, mitochondrial n=1 Tax=Cytospora mali TaxID=578113 RepID=A0A194W847_CYTMA|nr:Translation initiation factor IF-2, mitochondrial [Valsa mali]